MLKSFDILHSALLFLLIACFLHVLFVDPPAFISASPGLTVLFMFLLIFLKIFLFSGMYGTIIELASQEQVAITNKIFFKNARRYWKIYLPLLILHFCANIFFAVFFNAFNLAFLYDNFFFDLFFIYLISFFIIRDKYIRKFGLPYKKIAVPPGHILSVTVLFILNILIGNVKKFFPIDFLSNEPIVIYTYLHFFIFTYFSMTILDRYADIEKHFDKEKEIYLVNPVSGGIVLGDASLLFRWYPPFFLTLKALTPKGYHFKEFNKISWKKRFYRGNKLVAVTCYTSNCCEAYKIAKEFKKRGSTVVMGGPHVTYLPQEALQFCDAVVTGEAESVWTEVVRDYENHTLKSIYQGVPLEDFHRHVQQELLNSPPAVIKDFLETTRGCKYHCHFCTIPLFTKGVVRKKPVEEVVALIQKIHPRRNQILSFIDNNIIADPEYAKELFRALIPLEISWASQCSIDIAKDEELLRLAKESGCVQLLFGYEITGESREKHKKGKFSLADQYIELTKKVKKTGITIKAHFILGFEADNYHTMLHIWKYCFFIMPYLTIISVLTPLPGSQIYYKLLREDRITNYNWRYYGLNNLVFEHRSFSHNLFHFLFPLHFILCLATTCSFGLVITAVILLDAYFFGLRHFLF